MLHSLTYLLKIYLAHKMVYFQLLLKTYLYFFNLFLCLVAVAVLSGVGYFFYSADQYKGVTDDNSILVYTVIPLVILILVAMMLLVLSLIGFIACFYKLKSLTIIYAILLACVIAAQLVGGTLVFVFKEDVVNELSNGFLNNMPAYGSNKAYTSAIDAIQTELMCCGVNSYTDWLKSVKIPPQSCCKTPGCITIIPAEIYTEGCADRLRDVLTQSAAVSISVAVIFALIQITGVIAAFILGCSRQSRSAQYVQI